MFDGHSDICLFYLRCNRYRHFFPGEELMLAKYYIYKLLNKS
jgi:hypothetical protein